MISDKITISMDEVNEATPVPGTPPIGFNCSYAPPESDTEEKLKRTGLLIGVCVAAVALLCISAVGVMAIIGPLNGINGGRTVSDYKAMVINEVNEELSKSDSKLKKMIEDAHVTVTVTSTEIIRCDVITLDGTDKVGKGDSNIDKVSMVIRFQWDGILHKGGYTDLNLVYNVQSKHYESKIVETTALVDEKSNPGDWSKLWFDVGWLIGEALAL